MYALSTPKEETTTAALRAAKRGLKGFVGGAGGPFFRKPKIGENETKREERGGGEKGKKSNALFTTVAPYVLL